VGAPFAGEIVELLDITHFINRANPALARGVNRRRESCWSTTSKFFRDMLGLACRRGLRS